VFSEAIAEVPKMGRKTARRLGSLMILLGVIGVISSIAW
jgi:hypothetical protein